MILKSFGCSFIFGTDLADLATSDPGGSRLTWPALLAQSVGADYTCHARPGAGNLQILEQVLNQAADPTPAVFVIGWTWIDRFDYHPANPDYSDPWGVWNTIMPIDKNDIANMYYRKLHSEYRDKFTNLGYIKLAIDTLKQKQIPFVMTYMDELLFDQRWNTSAAVTDLQQHVQPHMTKFNNLTFLDWSRHHGYSISDSLHPLEAAHANAAELIKSYNLV